MTTPPGSPPKSSPPKRMAPSIARAEPASGPTAALEKRNEGLSQEIASLRRELEAQQQRHAAEVQKDRLSAVAAAREETAQYHHQQQQQQQREQQLQEEADAWRGKFSALQQEHTSLMQRCDADAKQAGLWQGAIAELREESTSLAAALAAARSDNEQLLLQVQTLQASCAAAQQAEQRGAEEREALATANQGLEAAVAHLKKLVRTLMGGKSGSPGAAEVGEVSTKATEQRQSQMQPLTSIDATPAGQNAAPAVPAVVAPRARHAHGQDRPSHVQQATDLQAPAPRRPGSTAAAASAPLAAAASAPLVQAPSQQLPTSVEPISHPAPANLRHIEMPKSAQELAQKVDALEAELLQLNVERSALEAEYARMPTNSAGKTLAERKRKAQVESRLAVLHRDASAVKLVLRRWGCR